MILPTMQEPILLYHVQLNLRELLVLSFVQGSYTSDEMCCLKDLPCGVEEDFNIYLM